LVPIAEAWVTAARGHLSAAASAANAAATIAAQHAFEILALHDAVRFGAGPGDTGLRLDELMGPVTSALAEQVALFSRALSIGDGGGLDETAKAFEAAGAML
jgi:hypothetical protein